MALHNFLIICASVATISAWTIDLPEPKKEVVNKNNREGLIRNHQLNFDKKENNYERRPEIEKEGVINFEKFFEDEGSEENEEEESYSELEEYNTKQSYMEKKVQNIVKSGNNYLEGLKMALESYIQDVKACSEKERSKGSGNKNDGTLESFLTDARRNFPLCDYVTEHSERIRRLSQMAIQTIGELQEKDLKEGYYGTLVSPDEDGMEERELILKLAWFLDQIAHLTGFDPNPERHIRKQTTTPPTPPSLLVRPTATPQPEIIRAMMECLNLNSSIPASIRCSYPEQYLQEWREMYNNLTATVQQSKQRDRSQPPTLNQEDLSVRRQKRSIENNPVMNVIQYYAKHKAWTLNNPENNDKNTQENHNIILVDSNDLPPKQLSKRSIQQEISDYLNLNAEAYLNPSSADAERINRALKDLHTGKRTIESIKNDLEITTGSKAL